MGIKQKPVVYPSTDGKPRAENTIQLRWILSLFTNLKWLLQGQEAFVAADLFWYPVQGEPKIVVAPDVMVAFGRPDGDRLSYKQWEEADVAPQVVIEVLSPGNTVIGMTRKEAFYERHGVEEYILIFPEEEQFQVCHRKEGHFLKSDFPLAKWTSPRLGITFAVEDEKLQVFDPEGNPFKSFEEVQTELQEMAKQMEAQETQFEAEKQRADAAEAELQALRARLRELEGDNSEK